MSSLPTWATLLSVTHPRQTQCPLQKDGGSLLLQEPTPSLDQEAGHHPAGCMSSLLDRSDQMPRSQTQWSYSKNQTPYFSHQALHSPALLNFLTASHTCVFPHLAFLCPWPPGPVSQPGNPLSPLLPYQPHHPIRFHPKKAPSRLAGQPRSSPQTSHFWRFQMQHSHVSSSLLGASVSPAGLRAQDMELRAGLFRSRC